MKKKREKKIATTTNLGRKTSSAPQLHSIERKKDLKREKRENKVIRVKMGRYQRKRKGKEGRSEDLEGGRGGGERENVTELMRSPQKINNKTINESQSKDQIEKKQKVWFISNKRNNNNNKRKNRVLNKRENIQREKTQKKIKCGKKQKNESKHSRQG